MKSKSRGEKSQSPLQRFLAWDWCLLSCCLVGVALGFAVGFTLYYQKVSDTALMWVGLPGQLYMRMMKAAVLPLLISSIIAGTAGLKPKENGKVSMVTLTYIIATNVIGGVIGVVMAVVIKPGMTDSSVSDSSLLGTGHLQTSDLFADLIRNLFPDNVVTSTFEKSQTGYRKVLVPATSMGDSNITNLTAASSSSNATADDVYERYLGKASGTNVLGLTIVCAVVGMASAQRGEAGRPFINFFTSCADILQLLVQWLIMCTPLGAASLIASAVGANSDLDATFRSMGLFVLAVVLGNVLILFVLLPLLHFLFLRQRNPFAWTLGATKPCMTALVTSSSMAAMPHHMQNMECRYGVDKRVTSFVVPLVTALNRDGSTMFIALTSIYMAQIQGNTSVDTILLITILSVVGSLAIPSTASASLMTVLMIVDSLGVEPANIGILLALEWFSDRIRTVTNNYSHVLCCLITWHLCKPSIQAASSSEGAGINGTAPSAGGGGDSNISSSETVHACPPVTFSSISEEEESFSPLLQGKNTEAFVDMGSNRLAERIPLREAKDNCA